MAYALLNGAIMVPSLRFVALRIALLLVPLACGADPSRAPASSEDDAGPTSAGSEAPAGVSPIGELTKNVSIDGATRSYLVYVSSAAAGRMREGGAPLIVALHGAGDRAAAFFEVTGLRALADREGVVIVLPDAPDGFAGSGAPASVRADVLFVLATVRATEASYSLDRRRYFLTGFSRGAGFAGLLATASGNGDPFAAQLGVPPFESVFAAVALSAGYDMFQGKVDLARATQKRPVWLLHSTDDSTVPFDYGSSFANALRDAGWPGVAFTPVAPVASHPPHNWLWQPAYGHSDDELWAWFSANALP